jgi:hypothetical protein
MPPRSSGQGRQGTATLRSAAQPYGPERLSDNVCRTSLMSAVDIPATLPHYRGARTTNSTNTQALWGDTIYEHGTATE